MSAIAPRIQSALLRWLLQEATRETTVSHSFTLATSATGLTVISVGERATLDTHQFELNFYSGFGNSQVALPAIVIVCSQATSQPDTPGIWEADVTVALEYQADNISGEDSPHIALEGAGNWIHDMLCDGDYTAQGLMEAEPNLIVMGVYGVSARTVTDGEKRIKSIQTDFKITASI